jgi:hypothetical protein
MPQMPLTDTAIKNAKPAATQRKLADEKGLFLLVHRFLVDPARLTVLLFESSVANFQLDYPKGAFMNKVTWLMGCSQIKNYTPTLVVLALVFPQASQIL